MTDQEKIELKPCPFCGGRAEIKGGLTVMESETGRYDSEVYWVECAGSEDVEPCGYKPDEISSDSFEGAAEHWNTRPIEDALREELEAWKNWAEMAFRYIRFGKIFKDDSSGDDAQRWMLIDTYNIEKERSDKKQLESGEPHESN